MVENQSLPSAPDVRWEFRLSFPRPKAHFSDVDFWGRRKGNLTTHVLMSAGERKRFFISPFCISHFFFCWQRWGEEKLSIKYLGRLRRKRDKIEPFLPSPRCEGCKNRTRMGLTFGKAPPKKQQWEVNCAHVDGNMGMGLFFRGRFLKMAEIIYHRSER